MWGDDPRDLEEREINPHGMVSVALPWSERSYCGCFVELEWIFRSGEQFAVACIPTKINPCNLHDNLAVTLQAESISNELYRRYADRFIKRAAPMSETKGDVSDKS